MNKSTTLLILTIVILSTALLVGNRLGFEWAGGDGVEKHISALSNGEEFRRGEVIRSLEGIRMVEFGDVRIFMEPNTEVRIEDGQLESLRIYVIKGRVVVEGPITITTREVYTDSNGLLSYVHYSWTDVVEIASVEGSAVVSVEELETEIKNSALSTSTLAPYNFEIIEFDPYNSASADFYTSICETWEVCFEL